MATSTPEPEIMMRGPNLSIRLAFDRHQPGLGEHEDRERDLDRRASPMVFLIDRPDEQRPAVLQVGDHHHADDAEDELTPAGRFRRGRDPAGLYPKFYG